MTDKELLTRPTTSLGKSQASAMPLSTENLEESNEDPCDVEENFSTKQLFSFAWQIAKGMVIIFFFGLCCWDSDSEYNLERRSQKSIFYKHKIDGINILSVFLDMSTLKWLIWKKKFLSGRPSFG